MYRISIVILAFLLTGCATGEQMKISKPSDLLEKVPGMKELKDLGTTAALLPTKTLLDFEGLGKHRAVSPTDYLYYKGNRHYNRLEFIEAIELYKQFIERKPNSNLIPPATLNLGMSYYYLQKYKDAYVTLNELAVDDPSIKAYVKKVLASCKTKAPEAIAEVETVRTEVAAEKERPVGGNIRITILDAYLDDIGNVIIKGQTNKAATIAVNGTRTGVDENNQFTASFSWKKGTSIPIRAKDENGNSGDLKYFPDSEPPDAPENLTPISISSDSIEIEWDANEEEDIKGYRLYYQPAGKSLQEIPELITETRYEVVGLAKFGVSTFQFYLEAYDKMDNRSDKSDTLEVTIP